MPADRTDAQATRAVARNPGGDGPPGMAGPRAAQAPIVRTPLGLLAATALVAVVLTLAAVVALVAGGVVPLRAVPTEGSPEVGFARDMSIHHAQAVEMSELVRERTDDQEVRVLAADISATQQAQIGWMSGWLDVWELPQFRAGQSMQWMDGAEMDAGDDEMDMADGETMAGGTAMPGMATGEQMAQLRDAEGDEAARLFLELMIDHHLGGVAMAQALLDRSDDDDVRALASSMVVAQDSEIVAMQQMLDARTN